MSAPQPLTPAQCDLRGLQFMPLDVGRVMDSDLFALTTGDEFKAAFALWCKSWTQVPAASLPTDERLLARFAGVNLAEWRGLGEMALRGWALCSDGRYYHPVVSEKALEAWSDRIAHRKRSAAANAAKSKKEFDPTPYEQAAEEASGLLQVVRGMQHGVAQNLQGDETAPSRSPSSSYKEPTRPPFPSEGTGTVGGEKKNSVPDGTGDDAPPDDPMEAVRAIPDLGKRAWDGLRLVLSRGDVSRSDAGKLIGSLKLPNEDLWALAEAAWQAGTHDPVPYLKRAAAEIARRKAVGSAEAIEAPSPDRQRGWMRDWVESGAHGWQRHVRGPRPNEPDCKVSPEILREFGFQPAKPRSVA